MVDAIKEKWSRGGAMFYMIYLALTRRYVRAVLAVIGLFIPFVNFVVMIALFIVGGLKGNHWINTDNSLTAEQKNTYTTFLDRVGYFVFLTVVVVIVVSLVAMLLGGGLMMFNMMGNGDRFGMPGGGFDLGDIDIGEIPAGEGQ